MVEESLNHLTHMLISMFTALVTGMARAVALSGLKMLLAPVAVIMVAVLACLLFKNHPKG